METVQGDLRSSLEVLRTGLLKGRVGRTAAFFEDPSRSSEQPEWNLPMRRDLRPDGWNLAERLEALGGRLDAERLEARGVGLGIASPCTPERYDISDGHDEAGNAEKYDDEGIVLLDAPTQRSEVREVSVQMRSRHREHGTAEPSAEFL